MNHFVEKNPDSVDGSHVQADADPLQALGLDKLTLTAANAWDRFCRGRIVNRFAHITGGRISIDDAEGQYLLGSREKNLDGPSVRLTVANPAMYLSLIHI